MRIRLLAVALLALVASTAQAQTTNTVNTGAASGSTSDSSSQSGAAASSNNANYVAPTQSTNVGTSVGTNVGTSANVALTFEASKIPTRTTSRFETNTAVPLTAAVSFSSDYCGGVASGGASAAGISLGGSKPMMDRNCQSLRRAEKFGVAAANAYGVGLHSVANKLIAMQVWEICMSEANVSERRGASEPSTRSACEGLGLVGPDVAVPSPTDVAAAASRNTQGIVQQASTNDATESRVVAAPRN
jgi:hypothetical protein